MRPIRELSRGSGAGPLPRAGALSGARARERAPAELGMDRAEVGRDSSELVLELEEEREEEEEEEEEEKWFMV